MTGTNDRSRAVAALHDALVEAAQVAEETGAHPDADAAFDLVVAFDEALAPAPTFARALSTLLRAGRPGEVVAADLMRSAELLEQRSREVATRSRELAALRAVEDEIRTRAEEAERLTREVAELQRLDTLAADLDHLRAARSALGRADGAALPASAEERALAEAAQSALEAVAKVSGALHTEVRAQLARLAEGTAELPRLRAELETATADIARDEAEVARLEGELATARARHEEIRVRLTGLVSGWQAHLAADRDVAAILLQDASADVAGRSPGAAVEEITAHVEGRLEQLDGLLRSLLVEAEAKDARNHRRRRMGAAEPPPTASPPSPPPDRAS